MVCVCVPNVAMLNASWHTHIHIITCTHKHEILHTCTHTRVPAAMNCCAKAVEDRTRREMRLTSSNHARTQEYIQTFTHTHTHTHQQQ